MWAVGGGGYLESRKAKLWGPGRLNASTIFWRFETPVLPSSRTKGLSSTKANKQAKQARNRANKQAGEELPN